MKLPDNEKKYYFLAGDELIIPEACYVVFFSVNGRVIHPELSAIMRIPKIFILDKE